MQTIIILSVIFCAKCLILKQQHDNQHNNTQYQAYHNDCCIVLLLHECSYTDSHYADCSYPECHCTKFLIMKQCHENQHNNTKYQAYHADCCIELLLHQCFYTNWHFTNSSYAECHYSKCRYTECWGVVWASISLGAVAALNMQKKHQWQIRNQIFNRWRWGSNLWITFHVE